MATTRVLSPFDALSDYLSPNLRTIGDYHLDLLGTWTQIIRVSVGQADPQEAWAGNQGKDVFGDFDRVPEAAGTPTTQITFSILDNVYIEYPYSKMEIFQKYSKQTTAIKGIAFEDNLPIEFTIKFGGVHEENAIHLKKGDLLFDYIKDESNNIVPIGFEVTQLFVSTYGKNITKKMGNLAPIRGDLEPLIRNEIEKYYKEISSAQPTVPQVTRDATQVVANSNIPSRGANVTSLVYSNLSTIITAQTVLPKNSIVTSTGRIGNSNDATQFGKIIGLTTSDVNPGLASIITFGAVTDASFSSFVAGDDLFLNGTSITTTPASTGFVQKIGQALGNYTIFIDIGEPLLN